MIVLSRAAVRSFRALLRRSVLAASPRGPAPPVLASATDRALTLRAARGEVGLALTLPATPESSGELALPGELLDRLEAASETPVLLESLAAGRGRARWEENHVPQTLDFDL